MRIGDYYEQRRMKRAGGSVNKASALKKLETARLGRTERQATIVNRGAESECASTILSQLR